MTDEQKKELHRLQKLTVTKLREESKAKYHDEIKGVSGMSKDEIIEAICEQQGIPYDEEKHKVAKGIDKAKFKKQISECKSQLEEKGKTKLERSILRKKVKRIKRVLRHAAAALI